MMEGPRHQHLHQERQEPLEERIRTQKLTIFALSATQELRFRGSSGQNAQFLPRTSLP